jgi:hypothetical protein
MRERLGVPAVLLGVLVFAVSVVGFAGTAAADSMTTLPSFSDPRTAMPNRAGHVIKRARYGPFNVGANSQVHNAIKFNAAPPCQNCWITDMVPSLVYESDANNANGTVANLNNDAMMHHFVLLNPQRTDTVCPGGLQASLGERFFASGNERSQMHLPGPYGYFNGTQTNWTLIYHLVNKAAVAKNISIEMVYQYRTAGGEDALPLWLDIDGCSDSEYPAPIGYSDTHVDWPSTVNGRMLAMNGHLHDVDITSASPCPDHCAAQGHGIALSAEIVGGPSGDYFGPVPPNNSPPADLTGTTLCRSEGYYGTSWATGTQGNAFRGHLDTMSSCGINSDLLATKQAQAFPAGGSFSFEGYPVKAGQVIRLHSEYQNNTGAIQNDVMGIMMAFIAPQNPGYPRPKGATPMRASLVPAYNQCTSPNRVHGPPDLPGGTNPDGSCNPPTQTSGQITVGSPDAAGGAANSVGFVRLSVINGNAATTADEADVRYTVSINDVRCKPGAGACGAANAAGGADYSGQVRAQSNLRITDRYNGPSEVGVGDTSFGVTVPCTVSGSTAIGSSCSIDTTADAVMPGVVKEIRRANWQMGQVQVFDGGADGAWSTTPNTLFAVQGVFVP